MRRAVLAAAVLLGGCGVRTGAVLEGGPVRADAAALQAGAEAAFAARPRTAEAVRSAYDGMAAAARGTGVGSPARYERLWRAASYAVWLAARPETAAYADSALVLANTAVEADSARVEGYYYRALAVGFVARADPLTGMSAMRRIRDDASRAVELDSAFDAGGPHRVLGALHLRAPGPPTGVGSLRRAVHHLEAAHRIGPSHPENLLFLAEAYLDTGRVEEARGLLGRAAALEPEEAGEDEWRRAWARQLRERLAP